MSLLFRSCTFAYGNVREEAKEDAAAERRRAPPPIPPARLHRVLFHLARPLAKVRFVVADQADAGNSCSISASVRPQLLVASLQSSPVLRQGLSWSTYRERWRLHKEKRTCEVLFQLLMLQRH